MERKIIDLLINMGTVAIPQNINNAWVPTKQV